MDEQGKNVSRMACLACRRQKRKCSRDIPSCELCRKNQRLCEYLDEGVSGYYTETSTPSVSDMGVLPDCSQNEWLFSNGTL